MLIQKYLPRGLLGRLPVPEDLCTQWSVFSEAVSRLKRPARRLPVPKDLSTQYGVFLGRACRHPRGLIGGYLSLNTCVHSTVCSQAELVRLKRPARRLSVPKDLCTQCDVFSD
ncbi:hypothetical protein Bbelb_236080 [Branchiostoma belcheri]|nr:hypothetical protein Bbelb_236080 [Branchiostoma belcheri]